MATRYQRDTQYQPVGVDTSGIELRSNLSRALADFSQMSGRRFGAIQAQRGAEAGAQSTGTPTLKSNFTAYGRAYNTAALRNYAIEQYTEIEKQLGRLENESAADPEKFQALADGLRKGILKAAPAQARADVANLFNRRFAEGVVRLDAQRIEQQKALNRGMLEQGLQTISDAISRKAASGDPASMAEIEEDEVHFDLMIDGALGDGTLSPVEAATLRRDGKKRITSQLITGMFERQITSDGGDPIGFLETLMNTDVSDLSDGEKQEVIGNLFTRLARRNQLASMSEQQETDLLKQRYAAGEKHATMLLLEGGLTTEKIASLVDNDYLDPGVGRVLQNELEEGGADFDDDRERFHVETNLFEFSEDEIAQNPRLTWETRRQLIAKRRDLASGWRSTQQAREGADRIDRALGIIPGMDTGFLSEEERRARDQALTEWYDQVDALPPEERQAKSIELSETVIQKVIRGNASKELQQLEGRLASYKQGKDPSKLKGAALKEYEDTVARYEQRIEAARRRAAQ